MFCVSILKFFLAILFPIISVFTSELYDTRMRGLTFGFYSAFSKLSVVIMP